ncbi:MAG: A24 family peptidase C-terminal domain-containing protein [Candidatus Geothermarchaeales archaeon]
MLEAFSLTKVALSLILFAIASHQDWEKREIEDKIWLTQGLGGGSITAVELIYLSDVSLYQVTLFSLILSLTLGFVLYHIGFVGGADAKAIWTLGLTFPYYPETFLIYPILPIYPLFIFTIFENSLILSLTPAIYCLARNLVIRLGGEHLFTYEIPAWKKIILLFTATKMFTHKIDWRKTFPVERVDFSTQPPRVTVEVFSKVTDEVEVDSLIKGVESGVLPQRVWISPGIPMIIFITLGLIVSILYGDLILYVILRLLGFL